MQLVEVGEICLPFSFHISNIDFISVFRIGLPSDFMCHSAEKADMVKDIFIYISLIVNENMLM